MDSDTRHNLWPLATGAVVALVVHAMAIPLLHGWLSRGPLARSEEPSVSQAADRAGEPMPALAPDAPPASRPAEPAAVEDPPAPETVKPDPPLADRPVLPPLPRVAAAAVPAPKPPAAQAHRQPAPAEAVEPPEVPLGRDDGTRPIRVAWISYDDFQKLAARRGVVEQPAVQMTARPVADAPLDPLPRDSSPRGQDAAAPAGEPGKPAGSLALKPAGGAAAGRPSEVRDPATPANDKPEAGPAPGESPSKQPPKAAEPAVEPAVKPIPAEPPASADARERAPADAEPPPTAVPLAQRQPAPGGSAEASPLPAIGKEPVSTDAAVAGGVAATVSPAPAMGGPADPAKPGRTALAPAPPAEPPALALAWPWSGAPVEPNLNSPAEAAATTQPSRLTPQPLAAGASSDRGTGSSQTTVSAGAGSGAPGRTGVAGASGGRSDAVASGSPRSNKQSPPVSLSDTPLNVPLRAGRVEVGQGLEARTRMPDLSVVARFKTPRNPIYRLTISPDGTVSSVTAIRDTGDSTWESPIVRSLYQWRFAGKQLETAGGPVSVPIHILLGRE